MNETRSKLRGIEGGHQTKMLKVATFALAGVFVAAMQAGAASAVTNSETNGVDQVVSVGAEVDVLAQCAWYLAGVDSSLTLLSAPDGLGGYEPYIGDALPISAADSSVQLYFSGASLENTACGIYVDGQAGIDLTVTLSDFNFVGTPADLSMDFALDPVTNPLTVDMGVNPESDACSISSWTDATDPTALSLDTIAKTVFGISDSAVRSGTYAPESGSLPNCDLAMSYSTNIPAGLIPDATGTYTYAGPEMTVTIVNSTPTP